MKHFGDITKINGAEVPVVDIITGGSPCQDLSVAGKRAGLAGERSGLFMEQMRIVKEMRNRNVRIAGSDQLVRLPRYCVWENVPGAFNSNGGKDFQAVLTEFARVAEPDAPDVPLPEKGKWGKAGCLYGAMGEWSVAWRVHDAQFWGVPQRRKRISLVADFGGLTAPGILFVRKGLSRDSEPSGEAWQEAAGAAGGGVEGASIGVDVYNQEVTGEVAASLTAASGGTNTSGPKAIAAGFSFGQSAKARSIGFEEEVSPTLRGGEGGNQKPCVLCLNDQGGSVIAINGEIAGTLDANYYKGCGERQGVEREVVLDTYRAVTGALGAAVQNAIVRRLTPLECERLQGYPDGWTDIGEWVDSKGKKHGEADSPRYKALGNSIALPFWQWMFGRIVEQYPAERRDKLTLGSLFDGIGGFPLTAQRNGIEPVWASEIEEFPIAVTKVRFPE